MIADPNYKLQFDTIDVNGIPFQTLVNPFGELIPYEFTGWKDEVRAWHETAYLGACLDAAQAMSISGPGATEFLKTILVNNLDNAPVGKSKRGMILNPMGTIAADGVLIREEEERWITCGLWPMDKFYLDQAQARGEFTEVVYNDEWATNVDFQIGGPRSLEIVESATGEDFHDLGYLCFRWSQINGVRVRVLRLGMAGTLSYEIHCPRETSKETYNAILAAGEPYGIKRLGLHAYMMDHTENGFMQACTHFMFDYRNTPGLAEWMETEAPFMLGQLEPPACNGSEQDAEKAFYVSPYDVGMGFIINYSTHDFVGKEAAWAKRGARHNKLVSLEWNAEDIADVYLSQYDGREKPYMDFENTVDFFMWDFVSSPSLLRADKVLNDSDEQIGISTGRTRIVCRNTMISLCSIDPDYAEPGTQVKIVWGSPDYPQKEIRATVCKFPYLDLPANADFDVSQVPHGNIKR